MLKKLSELSYQARRIVEELRDTEGHFLTASTARSKMNAVYELQDNVYLVPHTMHGNNGYTLTSHAKRQLKLTSKASVTTSTVPQPEAQGGFSDDEGDTEE